MPSKLIFVSVVALIALACGSPLPTPTVAPSPTATVPSPSQTPGASELSGATFSVVGGCGDAYLWAATPDGTTAITFEWTSAASNAWAAGGFHQVAQLPDPNIHIRLVSGSGLDTLYCNDMLMPGQGETMSTDAVVGAAEASVRPDAGGFRPAAHADAVIQDVIFNVTVGTEIEVWHLDEIVWQDVSVGWLAG